jgi:peptidoglycan/xylan/chitin deacetylase (PgdA/CDA1 family)
VSHDTTQGWGPARKAGAFSLSFDNLGEAADLELARHPADQPLGQHFTATHLLPEVLRLVDGLPITYFIEAMNVQWYPDALRRIRDAGIEIGLHAWAHENWARPDAAARRDILQRSMAAYDSLGITPRGFRPPGGALPEGAIDEFRAVGLRYCSPAGSAGASHGVGTGADAFAVLPFAWRHVDVYLMDPRLEAFRARQGDRAAAATPAGWRETVLDALALARSGQHVTLVFHPFFFGPDPAMRAVLVELIDLLRRSEDLWVASCGAVADWLCQPLTTD